MVVVPPQAAARVPVSKVSAAKVPPNGHLHVGVRVDAARDDVLPGGVDHCGRRSSLGGGGAGGGEGGDAAVLDQDVGVASRRTR